MQGVNHITRAFVAAQNCGKMHTLKRWNRGENVSVSEHSFDLPADDLLDMAPADVQQQAARLVQEAFGAAFRLSIEVTDEQRQSAIAKLGGHLVEWAGMATPEERDLRMAMLLAGLDQWGLAFSQTFGAGGLQGLSELVGQLRDALDPEEEVACQKWFDHLRGSEDAGFDFKVLLRRELHLALWHAMVSAEDRAGADVILQSLGGMIVSLLAAMPKQGWRLVADALASIQMRCLAQGLATEGLPLETTQSLLASIVAALPADVGQRVMQQSSEAVRAWQFARHSAQQ